VKHEDDYKKNILTGVYSKTKFGELVRRAIHERRCLISDYELYAPSRSEPAAFIAQPMIYHNQVELVVALQLPIDPINAIMQEQDMLGETSKTYLVGSDLLMRSDIESDKDTHSAAASMAALRKVDTEPVHLALSGQKGVMKTTDYKENHVISAYIPLKIQDISWALLAEIDVQEVVRDSGAAKALFTKFSKIGVAAVIILTLAIFLIAVKMIVSLRTLILKPLDHVSGVAESLTNYDLSGRLEVLREDEIGHLQHAVNTMIESLIRIISSATQIADHVNAIAIQISDTVSEQAAVMMEQSASVTEITSTMQEFAASSAQIAENSNSVVAIAAHTLKSSQEGADSMSQVMVKMNVIDENNQNNIRQIMELRKKTDEITKVMEIINSIADQTKLIAFNAALEASGAGESGKRFGVVAVEIRRLADSVTASTGEIENKIREIQEASNHMVVASEKSTKGIQEAIVSFNETGELLNLILTEAMETTEAAKQISLSTQQQKTATEQIVAALKDISQGSEQTSESVTHISGIAKQLSDLSDELKELMKKFVLP
jgi:methyl-accepting chemotaxis protein